ncbi:MAG: GntR family transcriptional regulator [Coriobacteriales bacterium]|jgi:GntR family transcriptional regulator|nr:GntR family transcriptional regulator [Coriobacteriales bacterium]
MEEFRIDEQSGIPVWIQVRKRLVYTIVSGQYKSGDQLPTVRELAVQLDINYNTVNKVYQDLERDGYIVTKRGRGTFVAAVGENILLALDNKIELLADELVREGFDFGMTGDEIIGIVKSCVKRHETITGGKADKKQVVQGKSDMMDNRGVDNRGGSAVGDQGAVRETRHAG